MSANPRNLQIAAFDYPLPAEKIAAYPLENRDQSRLLQFKNEQISDHCFQELPNEIPSNTWLVFNETKVVPARLIFEKNTGGRIEVFCLEPIAELGDMHQALSNTQAVLIHCLVGGASKWKKGTVLTQEKEGIQLNVELKKKEQDSFVLSFSWRPAYYTFAEILAVFGQTPLPPYLKREAVATDASRYQTVYATKEGSVAAPTAGLHFTPAIMQALDRRSIARAQVILHVGSGTFKPVKALTLSEHQMHYEWIEASLEFLKTWRMRVHQPLLAVGTTSLRTLESLYWMGVKIMNAHADSVPTLSQWEPYHLNTASISVQEALDNLIQWMEIRKLDRLVTQTGLLVAPGYTIKTSSGLITNFHQPRSTLLLLVAALVGDDWKKIYSHALKNDYRFLSYGDSSLLWRYDPIT
ncbi:MAG: S-adenosylmethionine:tRNA ribosyltransferase-isomerase [Bacteroidetes bacterium]|nr:S-adenosylmethionine:tRNA ribosyltransferase-isomerase [Bacteroidota bacterium]